MNCNNCSAQFDHNIHVPRLLIFCGHSLCELCCLKIHNSNRIQCPECSSNTFIEEVGFLPKNLALLKVNNNSLGNSSNSYCLKHEKKYEAFCKKQKMLICVDCILIDSHRNHEMDSIKNAYTFEEATLAETISQVENLIKINKSKSEQNIENQKISYENYQSTNASLVQQFHQLRQLIQREQENLVNKVKEQYTQYQSKFQQKNNKYNEIMQNLSNYLQIFQHDSSLPEIQFLSNVTCREEIKTNINYHIQECQKIFNPALSKNSTAETVIKTIEKHFKTTNYSTVNKTQCNGGSKTKKVATQHQKIQCIKSIENQQLGSSTNNQKSITKKQNKRQAVPLTYTPNSIASSVIFNKNNPPLTKSCTVSESEKRVVQKQKTYDKDKIDTIKNCEVSMVEQKQSLFNSFFSNITSFLTEQKFIYVIGGFDDQNSNIIRVNLSNYKWEQISSLKAPRSKFGCATVEKNIFIMGGKKGRERVSDVQVWNNGNWKTNITLKRKRSGFGVISYDHLIYVIGGNDGENILNTVDILDTVTGEWDRSEPMMQTRDELAVCIGKDKKIFAIGGFGGKNNEPLTSVEIFDIRLQKWCKAPSMNTPRRALAAAALADGIYAIGGFDGTKHLNSVQKYEQENSQWVKIADLKRGRCTHSAVSIFETQQIIVMGGFDEEALDSVEKYSLISNEWEEITKMPSPRFMHASVLLSE